MACACVCVCVYHSKSKERKTAIVSCSYPHIYSMCAIRGLFSYCMLNCMYKCVRMCVSVGVCLRYLLVEYGGVRQDLVQAEGLLIAYSVQRGCLWERDRAVRLYLSHLCSQGLLNFISIVTHKQTCIQFDLCV